MAKCKQAPNQNMGANKHLILNLPHISPIVCKIVWFFSGYGDSYPVRRKSDAVQKLQNLIQRLHNVECYPSRIQVYIIDHE